MSTTAHCKKCESKLLAQCQENSIFTLNGIAVYVVGNSIKNESNSEQPISVQFFYKYTCEYISCQTIPKTIIVFNEQWNWDGARMNNFFKTNNVWFFVVFSEKTIL